jgi:hypothetical protein
MWLRKGILVGFCGDDYEPSVFMLKRFLMFFSDEVLYQILSFPYFLLVYRMHANMLFLARV